MSEQKMLILTNKVFMGGGREYKSGAKVGEEKSGSIGVDLQHQGKLKIKKERKKEKSTMLLRFADQSFRNNEMAVLMNMLLLQSQLRNIIIHRKEQEYLEELNLWLRPRKKKNPFFF